MDGRYAEMKEKCNLVETARDGTIPALTVNKIDVIMPSLAITEKRKETMGFSSAYYTSAAILMGARSATWISRPHLAGKTNGVQVSSLRAAGLDKYFRATSAIKTYETQDEANQGLAAGRLDYVMANGIALDAFLKSE